MRTIVMEVVEIKLDWNFLLRLLWLNLRGSYSSGHWLEALSYRIGLTEAEETVHPILITSE